MEKYMIIACGYTSRLINKLEFDVIKDNDNNMILKHKWKTLSDAKHCYKNIRDNTFLVNETIDIFFEDLVFISDGLWGDGLYRHDNKDLVDNILNMIEGKIQRDGIICFKGSSYAEYIMILENCDFCYGCNLDSIEFDRSIYINDDNNNIQISVFYLDTESG